MIPGQIVCEDYQIIRKVGQGSFGYVYKVRHRRTHQLYALKTDEKSVTKMQLQNQIEVLKLIQIKLKNNYKKQQKQSQGSISICLDQFLSENQSNKMLMALLGQNIYNLFQKCNKRFDSHTIYEVSKEMLKNIEFIHNLGFIHRDIKPQNFVISQGFDQKDKGHGDDRIYLVDFGLTKQYLLNGKKDNHISYEIGRKIRGTPMYMSINIMLGIEPSRRDDLESLMYIIVLLMKGRLPWHNMKITRKDFDELIMAKISINPDDLFANLPNQLKEAFIYIRKLKFEQKPNYKLILQSFESILSCKNQKIEQQYNGKYRKYCWQMMYEKQTFVQVSQGLVEYVKKTWLQGLNKNTQYSLLK